MSTGKSILVAGAVGAVIVLVLGNVISNISQQVFPNSPMLSTAGVGFGIGAGIQIAVRVMGVS